MATAASDSLSPVISSNEEAEESLIASTESKKRNKLGYHRTAVACGHCRRRKIRCIPAMDPAMNRCQNCIRLKKECQYLPVDQNVTSRKGRTPSKAEMGGNELDLSAGSSSPVITQMASNKVSEDDPMGTSAHIHSWLNHTTLRAQNTDSVPLMPIPDFQEGGWHTPPTTGPVNNFRPLHHSQPGLETGNLWLSPAEGQGGYLNSSYANTIAPTRGVMYQEPQFAYDASQFDKQRYTSVRQSFHGVPMYESMPPQTFASPAALDSQRRMTTPAVMYAHHGSNLDANMDMNGAQEHGLAPDYHTNTFDSFHGQVLPPYQYSSEQREAQSRYLQSQHTRPPDFAPNPG